MKTDQERGNETMDTNFYLGLIEIVEESVKYSVDGLILCHWARIRAEAGTMTPADYFAFKTKLGMGH